ncbi:hypothetical protein D5B42_23115 [Salmonella enterica subsp. enterica serovar Oranienburg]|nr:hypothetical protein [Salmonella enterica subsp. enterica serovar Oranienburg]
MDVSNIPLIYLLNTDLDTERKLKASGFNAHRYQLNGYVLNQQSYISSLIPYIHNIPDNLHEAEIVVIDTSLSNFSHAQEKTSNFNLAFQNTPSYVDLLPIDMSVIRKNIFSTKKTQAVFVFCDSNTETYYQISTASGRSTNNFEYNTYDFDSYLGLAERSGSRFKKPDEVIIKSITDCLFKYIKGSHYNIVFNGVRDGDIILAENEIGEVVSFIRVIKGKYFVFLPAIYNKSDFLEDLINNVLPDTPLFDDFFPNNGSFLWVNSDLYVSHEEKQKSHEIENLKKEFDLNLQKLQSEMHDISNKEENLKTKSLLTATDDELVFAVKWFLEYIGFENVVDPDKDVKEEDGEVFEEDLNIETAEKTYLFEVKGIGGTSSDDQCAQISKIVYRREEAFPDKSFKGVYIVNHQRHKEPKERKNPPFFDKQILDAKIAYRGMTFTYELFQVYHMIEAGILTKEDVRAAFDQRGLIDFRKSLKPLVCDHTFRDINVYSFDLTETPDTTISNMDKVIVKDEDNHWHLLSITGIQVNRKPLEEATAESGGSAGVQVDKLVPGAREYFLRKA